MYRRLLQRGLDHSLALKTAVTTAALNHTIPRLDGSGVMLTKKKTPQRPFLRLFPPALLPPHLTFTESTNSSSISHFDNHHENNHMAYATRHTSRSIDSVPNGPWWQDRRMILSNPGKRTAKYGKTGNETIDSEMDELESPRKALQTLLD